MCSVRLREKIFVHREREGKREKRRKIFGEGKCLSTEEKKSRGEKKEDDIWSTEDKKNRKGKIFGGGKIFGPWRNIRKEKKNKNNRKMFGPQRRRRAEKEKEEIIW